MGRHAVRLGLNEWYYHLNYHSSSLQWTGTVSPYPQVLYSMSTDPADPTQTAKRTQFFGFNELSPEYTKGSENKLALYLTDNWKISDKLNLYYGGRLEYYRMSADQIAQSRFSGFHIGDFNTYNRDENGNIVATEHSIHPANVTKNKLNYAATAQLTYDIV